MSKCQSDIEGVLVGRAPLWGVAVAGQDKF